MIDHQEAQTGVLKVSFDIESVQRMIEYMYTGDYQISPDPVVLQFFSPDASAPLAVARLSEDTDLGSF